MYHKLVLVLIPVLKEDRVELEYCICLLTREQELDYLTTSWLHVFGHWVSSMVAVRLDIEPSIFGRQYQFLALVLESHNTLDNLHIFFLDMEMCWRLLIKEFLAFVKIE